MGKMKHKRQQGTFVGPKVLVCHEKHDKVYMDATTEDAFHRSALRILRGRLSLPDSYHFFEHDRQEAEQVVSKKNAEAAWDILQVRNNKEYEFVELVSISTEYIKENDE